MQLLQCHLCKSLNPYGADVDLYCTAGKVKMEGSNLVLYKSRKFINSKNEKHRGIFQTGGI